MTAMPAAKLRDPEELYLPSEYSEGWITRIVDSLTPEGGRRFARDVMEAIEQAREEGDLRPINAVIESWYRTLLFLSRPEFEERWNRSLEDEGPLLSLDDIRHRRGLKTR